tara:strand:+ start:1 stop:1341 length:1341 start_codon:yes stop_codon:yes gene_type:complete
MQKQKKKAKEAGRFKKDVNELNWVELSSGEDSEFVGYDTLNTDAKIRRFANLDNKILLVLDRTPFYAESGGQVGDIGCIEDNGTKLNVINVVKENNTHIHICEGSFDMENIIVKCAVDSSYRSAVKKNHTATHLMHKALKTILGDHVNQAGSLVHPDYLRFDLTHFDKISNHELLEIEKIVNTQILLNTKIDVSVQNYDDAKQSGAEALFGEKYGDEVRVVRVGDFSKELCGGTHVNRTGDIGSFKVTSESSLSSGVRRIVALTGTKAISYMQMNHSIVSEMQTILNVPPNGMIDRLNAILKEKKDLEKRLKQKKDISSHSENIFDEIEKIGDYQLLVKKLDIANMDQLKSFGDKVYDRLKDGVAVLFSVSDEKPMAVIVVSKEMNGRGILAGNLAKQVGGFMGGGGGGKPRLATAGGKSIDSIDDAIVQTIELVQNLLKRLDDAV